MSKKKKKKKFGVVDAIKWFFVILACLILTLGIIGRVQHYFTYHTLK